ncbi:MULTISPECIES: antibiotic biosynthesis monooxygenase [Shouchella]|jgi:heme-degrading monooxygenase HmoA|uniref:Antibiotic biosynthesis monooxygenase n=1 Tax=Shouchella clausii TaxID=79880 RepID=A0A268RZ93_SHOCL|nr:MULTISPECIES: antibiotic biosynthesis monooxygenase [Shouchella]PAD41775.1 antibiotic biosynthesis monooxygenase [Bacillus sp. 7520-S]SPU22339.1 putative antibiotic synthesis monooxygenase [Niallia circulans]AST98297.1 antibiotic biosynthesis monooxygenase [Shouchella clausii]MBU8595144.1 antibiotic biosynthesis monooxygenase [Shouchella clausii]MCR1289062.1 antibiotic biosynthesis monooxygenase [Shouchella clausii]
MYVVMNELHVPPERKAVLTERFRQSAERMAEVPGCLEFLFLSNIEETGKQIVFTKWASKQDYENWLSSPAFANAHSGKPKQEKPAASANELFAYEVAHHFCKGD